MQSIPSKTDFWHEHIEHWRNSGMSQRAYCEQHDLKLHVFIYWKRKQDTPHDDSAGSTGNFIPVSVKQDVQTEGLFIKLPNGVHIGGITSSDQVVSLIQALS